MGEITRRSVLEHGLAAGSAIVASTARAPPESADIHPRERAAMAAAANAFMQEYDIPGLAVAIARGERLVYAQGFGVANKRTGETVTPAHLFRIASISKPITSVAIFSLLEQGKLALGDRVFGPGAILDPYFAIRPGTLVDDITIDHLLTHAAGGWPNGPDDPMSKPMDHHELIAWTLDNVPLVSPPGTRFIYSNFGYCVLGRVIERITRKSYEAYVRESVLARCGITAMRIGGDTLAERADGEVVYYHPTRDPYPKDMMRIDSTGGWISSVLDLVRLATHVDGFPHVPDILQPEAIRIMTTPSPVLPRYARGWGVGDANWWRDGVLPGTTSSIDLHLGGSCWAALDNASGTHSYRGLDQTLRRMIRSVTRWSGEVEADPLRGRPGQRDDEDFEAVEQGAAEQRLPQ